MNRQVIQSVEEFKEWIAWKHGPITALDFETTSLDYLEMEFVGFSLYNGSFACYVSQKDCLSYLGNLLKTGKWVFHNSVFDLKCCDKFCGASPKDIFCTLTGAKLVNENRVGHKPYGLKTLAIDWLGVEEVKTWQEAEGTPDFPDYAMNDSIWTYQLWELEREEIRKQKLEQICQIEMDYQFVLRDMEINGIFVDKKKLEEFKGECHKILYSIEADMLATFGKCHNSNTNLFGEVEHTSPINFDSSPQLICCIESLGLVITERTKPSKTHPKGQKSVGKKTKTNLKGQHPFIDLLIRYDKLSQLYNTFIEPCEDFIDSDGRIRTSYGLKKTGRLSSSQPNLQNLPNPKKEKLEFNYGEIFVPEGEWPNE